MCLETMSSLFFPFCYPHMSHFSSLFNKHLGSGISVLIFLLHLSYSDNGVLKSSAIYIHIHVYFSYFSYLAVD